MYMYLITVCLFLASFSTGHETTMKTPKKAAPSLESRITNLERVLASVLTGKDNASITDIQVIKFQKKEILPIRKNLVAFSAWMKTKSGMSPGFSLKFGNVTTNIGDHYHPTDGIFIAPVHGLYMFHWTMNCFHSGSHHCATSLMVDGVKKGYIISGENAGNYYHTGSNTLLLELKAGTHVWVQVETYTNVYLYDYTSFTGCLLSIY
ncbi:cerebellin-2-like [Saccostrea echinata]|uniref:cerebellin-2-like n=1 Tax=Saccostrea echinata TaxID=191078 RepID=UPI002A81E43F|nr:cerebellin-2-like [Saccostrea echinata]